MRGLIQFLLAASLCVAVAIGAVVWITGGPDWLRKAVSRTPGASQTVNSQLDSPYVTWYPDPNAPGTSAQVCVNRRAIDRFIGVYAFSYKGTIRDPGSLGELRDAIRVRGRRGIAALRQSYDDLKLGAPTTFDQALKAIPLARSIAFFYMHEGDFGEADEWLQRGLDLCRKYEIPLETQAEFHALLGIAALRRGEIENCLDCVGPSSCIFPIDRRAVHIQQAGSREAVEHFTAYLKWCARRPALPLAA